MHSRHPGFLFFFVLFLFFLLLQTSSDIQHLKAIKHSQRHPTIQHLSHNKLRLHLNSDDHPKNDKVRRKNTPKHPYLSNKTSLKPQTNLKMNPKRSSTSHLTPKINFPEVESYNPKTNSLLLLSFTLHLTPLCPIIRNTISCNKFPLRKPRILMLPRPLHEIFLLRR